MIIINIEKFLSQYEHGAAQSDSQSLAMQLGLCLANYQWRLAKFLGIVSEDGALEADPYVLVGSVNDTEKMIRDGWNSRAKDWLAIENQKTYIVTLATLMENFRLSEKGGVESILSLGSGPGLYETFLGAIFLQFGLKNKVEIKAVDFASEMTEVHRKILDLSRLRKGKWQLPIDNVTPMTGDMTNLIDFADKSVDQVIVNNSLQWVPEWRKVLGEIQRVINPEGLGYVQIFVNNQPMRMVGPDIEPIELGGFNMESLLDELECRNFEILNWRTMEGVPGTGQWGGTMSRTYVRAQYNAKGGFTRFRDKQVERVGTIMSMR